MINLTNLINLWKTWYKDVDIEIEPWGNLYSLTVTDQRTKCVYHNCTVDEVLRCFRDLGRTRKAWGLL